MPFSISIILYNLSTWRDLAFSETQNKSERKRFWLGNLRGKSKYMKFDKKQLRVSMRQEQRHSNNRSQPRHCAIGIKHGGESAIKTI